MPFELTAEQKIAVENRGGALLVSAAAGSGKTRVLVERLMSYVASGRDIDEFLVITFTNAAAAELRQRVAAELTARLAADGRSSHLRRQTALVYKAGICTIDAFCRDFLRECGHLAGVDPDFRICDEGECAAMRAAAMDRVMEARYDRIGTDPGFQELVEALAGDRDDQKLTDVVEEIYRQVQSHPDPAGWLRARRDDFDVAADGDPGDTAWGRLLLEDAARTLEYWAAALGRLREEAAGDEVVEANYGGGLELTVSDLLGFAQACRTGWDAAAACEVRFPTGGRKRGGDAALKERIQSWRKRCREQLKKLDQRLNIPGGAVMEDLRALHPAMSTLLDVVGEFAAAYQQEKGDRFLDFSDLEHRAAALLVDAGGNPTPLALEWRGRFTEIMVDEYQDTNEVQNVLFNALSRDGTNLFLVGDVKQSIYRFRLADPTIFLEKYRSYRPAAEAAEGEPRRQLLSANFRSRPEVLEGVNFLFRGIMSRRLGELDYTDDEALRPGREGLEPDKDCRVELNVVDLSDGEDAEDGEEAADKDLAEARAVARRLRELYDSGFAAEEGEGARAVRWEDMAVLLRSHAPLLHCYTQAFGELDIPWTADGGESFYDSTEVHVALAFLQIVDNPRQDVPLLAALRSPVCAFSPDRLAQLRAGGEGDLYDALCAGAERGEEDCAAFLTELELLRAQAGERSSHRFLWYLYERTGMPGIFGAMEDGARRRENLMALYDCARQFEAGGHRGLFGFLEHMTRIMDEGLPLPGPAREGGGVKVMSIHRSKGLEFPVAVVAGLERRFNDQDLRSTILFHSALGLGPKRVDRARMLRSTNVAREAVALARRQESRAEEMRLLYVAMTRAQRKLILFAALNARTAAALAEQAEYPVHPQVLAGCGAPAGWVLLPALCRRDAGALHALAGRAPDRLLEAAGDGWDIRVVDGAPLRKAPERRSAAQAAQPEQGAAWDPELAARLTWRYPHAQQVDLPSKLTATQLKGRWLDEEAAEYTERNAFRAGRPLTRPRFAAEERGLTPAQRGSALHLALQQSNPEKAATREGAAEELARLTAGGWLTQKQAEAVDPAWIAGFWRSPLGREARSAARMEREFKFSLLVPAQRYFPQAEEGEEVLLQGVADCWFQDGDGALTVIDFKTDAVTEQTAPARAAQYVPQLEAYAQALSQVLGAEVKRRVLWFFRLGKAVEL